MTKAQTTAAPTPTDGQVSTVTSAPVEGATPATSAPVAQQQPATEGQNPAPQAEPGKTEGEQANPTEVAPDKYEFNAPEGQYFDPEVLTAYTDIAKELNLPQDAAQKILDKVGPALAEKQTRLIEQARTEWGDAAKSDKEFGGDKFDENLAVAVKAANAFGTPELRTLLNESGLGNHPEIIRFMFRTGKAISEDGFVPNGRNSVATDPAKRLFPNQA